MLLGFLINLNLIVIISVFKLISVIYLHVNYSGDPINKVKDSRYYGLIYFIQILLYT